MPWERDVDLRAKAQQANPEVVEDGNVAPIVATRDLALFTADWYLKQALRGKIFQVAGGATDQGFSDPGTFGAGALDTDEFDLLLTVPLGTTIIPLEWILTLETFGTTSLLEILLAWGIDAVVGANAVTLVPVNQNLGSNRVSAITNNVVMLGDNGGTALTKEGEIFRGGLQLVEDIAANDNAAWPSQFGWKAEGPSDLHIIEGPRLIAGWVSSQAGTGFQKFTYLELETGVDIG